MIIRKTKHLTKNCKRITLFTSNNYHRASPTFYTSSLTPCPHITTSIFKLDDLLGVLFFLFFFCLPFGPISHEKILLVVFGIVIVCVVQRRHGRWKIEKRFYFYEWESVKTVKKRLYSKNVVSFMKYKCFALVLPHHNLGNSSEMEISQIGQHWFMLTVSCLHPSQILQKLHS